MHRPGGAAVGGADLIRRGRPGHTKKRVQRLVPGHGPPHQGPARNQPPALSTACRRQGRTSRFRYLGAVLRPNHPDIGDRPRSTRRYRAGRASGRRGDPDHARRTFPKQIQLLAATAARRATISIRRSGIQPTIPGRLFPLGEICDYSGLFGPVLLDPLRLRDASRCPVDAPRPSVSSRWRRARVRVPTSTCRSR
jgi:hypothetical protein